MVESHAKGIGINMKAVRLFNFAKGIYENVRPDEIAPAQGLEYVPTEFETISESYQEYLRIGLTPYDAIRMTTYEVLLAFRDVLIDKLETNTIEIEVEEKE